MTLETLDRVSQVFPVWIFDIILLFVCYPIDLFLGGQLPLTHAFLLFPVDIQCRLFHLIHSCFA